jgi:hypothetical protein
MVAFIIKLFLINSINNQVVINYYFNNNTFDTLPVFQSDTMGSELRNMVAICLNHHRDEGLIGLYLYMSGVTTK